MKQWTHIGKRSWPQWFIDYRMKVMFSNDFGPDRSGSNHTFITDRDK